MEVAAVAALAGVAYVRLARRVTAKGRPWPSARSAAAVAGVAVAIASALVGDGSFTRHMLEHMLLGMVVPLLAVLAAPVTLVLQGGGPATRSGVRRVLRSGAGRVLAHPVVGFAAFGVSVVALYLTPLLEVTTRSTIVHAAAHVHLVLVGVLFLVPVVGVDALPHPPPFGARLLALLVAVPFHAFVGIALASADEPVAPDAYPSLDDQGSAAAILWASGELFTLLVAAIVFRRWWASESRAAAREEPSNVR